MNAAQELASIERDLDATSRAWVAAGHPASGPEFDAREAAFGLLREWNEQYARRKWRWNAPPSEVTPATAGGSESYRDPDA